jgi:hypothetical protein
MTLFEFEIYIHFKAFMEFVSVGKEEKRKTSKIWMCLNFFQDKGWHVVFESGF